MPEATTHAAGEESAADHGTLLRLLNAAPLGLVQFALDGEVELINALSKKLLLPLVHDGDFGNLYTVLASQVPDLPRRVADHPPGQGMVFENLALDFSAVAPRESDRHHVLLSVMRLDGQRMMALIADVTTQVREASRVHGQFLARMSHEARTPLNAIIGFTEVLQRGTVPPGSPKHGQYLQHINTSGRQLLQLIDDVLAMAKAASGTFEPQPAVPDAQAKAAEVLAQRQAAGHPDPLG